MKNFLKFSLSVSKSGLQSVVQLLTENLRSSFDIKGATYYAVAEAGYSYSAAENIYYANRKYNTLWAATGAIDTTGASGQQVINILGSWAAVDISMNGRQIVNGYAPSASQPLVIRALGDARHTGKWTTTAYIASRSSNEQLYMGDHTRIEGIQWEYDLTDRTNDSMLAALTGITCTIEVSECLFRTVLAGTCSQIRSINSSRSTVTWKVSNCVFDISGVAGGAGFYAGDGINYVYNCTVNGGDTGFAQAAGTTTLKNCIAQNCTDGFSGTFDAASDYNVSDIASDAPGTNSSTATATFVNAGSGDFHLASGDTACRGNGANLSADSSYPITTDIDGQTRSAWDVGADEYSA